MIEIGEPCWRKIHEYVLALSSCHTREALFATAVSGICDLIPFDAGGGLFDPTTTKFLTGVGLSDAANRAYNSYYYNRQPWMTPDRRGDHPPAPPADGPMGSMRLAWQSYADSEYVCDFARPNGLAYAMADTSHRQAVTFSLQRSRWGPAFSDTECVIVTVVDLHINNLLDILKQNEMSPQPDRSRIKERFPVLSDREAEVLALLSWGLPARAIGTKLFISPRTVEAHIRSIYAKLDVRTKAEAIALASSRRDSDGVLVSLP